jgi:apolipoprotein N-acyltransferase
MQRLRLYLLGLSSALLFALGLPNELFLMGFAPLGFVALIPLYIALLEVSDWRSAALVTATYGAAHHAISSYWLYFFKDFAFWTIGMTTIAYFVIYFFLGLCLVYLLRRSGPLRPLAFALLWTSYEYLKSSGFLGYPWGLLPYTQSDFLPLLQIADWTGVYGLSFVLAFANAALAECFFRSAPTPALALGDLGRQDLRFQKGRAGGKRRFQLRILQPESRALGKTEGFRTLITAAILIVLALGYGTWRLATPPATRGSLRTLLIQQNLDPWSEGTEAALVANMRLMKQALAGSDTRPDLALFSESSLGYPYADSEAWYQRSPKDDPFVPWFKQQGVWLLTGSPIVLDWKNFSATNSVILIAPSGKVVEDYAKIHPVPFAEAIPFYEYQWFRDFLKRAVGLEAGWTMGSRYTIFSLPTREGTVRFGAPICFEDAFAALCRRFVRDGADVLVNLTDDSWSKTKSAEYQHLAAARFRSIEARRSLVRSTNSGVSAVVDPLGRITASLPLFVAAEETVEVPISAAGPTPYMSFGDWFAFLCLLLSFGWTLILSGREILRRRRRV